MSVHGVSPAEVQADAHSARGDLGAEQSRPIAEVGDQRRDDRIPLCMRSEGTYAEVGVDAVEQLCEKEYAQSDFAK